jgi:tRNA threonylcarbamoyl adenosine modification protein YjeE
MLATSSGSYSFEAVLADEQATEALMRDIAALIEPGDLITLSGDLGAGKTTFARAFIRHAAGNDAIEVPSPTFTLMQSYELPRFTLLHADFYRLTSADELTELGFDELRQGAVTLLEWPDRAAALLPQDRLDLELTLMPERGPTVRHVRVAGLGKLAARTERMTHIRDFLVAQGFGEALRRRIQGDASTRVYERLVRDGQSFVLMNAPRRPDGPPVRDGKPYSQIAHLAEDVTPFIAMAHGLVERGFSAPRILASERETGLLILEDLGHELVVRGDPSAPIEERYAVAVDALAALHSLDLPDTLPVERGLDHRLPRYDRDALLIELELLLDWYLPKLKSVISDSNREAFFYHWEEALVPALEAPQTWMLRDYHSPNLLWLPQRQGIARIGLLDFQDAMMGPAAYDVASLLQDARVDVPEALEISLLTRYLRERHAADSSFDAELFTQIYATLAAQRASKILGIFARLEKRDRKPQYLRHMPRVWGYLRRALAHPALANLQSWYRAHVPALRV